MATGGDGGAVVAARRCLMYAFLKEHYNVEYSACARPLVHRARFLRNVVLQQRQKARLDDMRSAMVGARLCCTSGAVYCNAGANF